MNDDQEKNDLEVVSLTKSEYVKFLGDIKSSIRSAQSKAARSVNTQLIELYLEIGRSICEAQKVHGWGKSVVKQLAKDLLIEFPGVKGFSARNLWRMKQLFELIQEDTKVSQLVTLLPWGHNLVLITKLRENHARIFYAKKAIENNWSRSALITQIEKGLYQRVGQAISNFESALPAVQSDMAKQIFKDPYIFDFLILGEEASERAMEVALIKHLEKFLIELGAGFAYVGRQVKIEVGGEEHYIDLLFYHLKLRAYVVIELKAVGFQPEFIGKVNFYLSAVDDLLKHSSDNPSIGLLLCKGKNAVKAQYALRGLNTPLGIADWQEKIEKCLPEHLKSSLPSIEDLESELSK